MSPCGELAIPRNLVSFQVTLSVLMEHFTALGYIFHFSKSSALASRKVTLVAIEANSQKKCHGMLPSVITALITSVSRYDLPNNGYVPSALIRYIVVREQDSSEHKCPEKS